MNSNPTLARPGGCWAQSVSAEALECRPGRGLGGCIGSGLWCGLDRRPSQDVGQSGPIASAYARGRMPGRRRRPQLCLRPGSWALAIGPGGKLLARRLARALTPADPWLSNPWPARTLTAGRRPGFGPWRPVRVGHSLPAGYLRGASPPGLPADP